MVTLRTFEFIIPFGTLVNLVIIDNNDDLICSCSYIWPRFGAYLGYEVIEVKPLFDKKFGQYLCFTIRERNGDSNNA